MNTKKILQIFLIIINVAYCNYCDLAFAEYNNSKKATGIDMKSCRGIGKIATKRKVIALTFDDGPHEKYTREILQILKQNNIKATFFVVGENAERYPDIIQTMHVDGNVVANHTYSHAFLTNLSDDGVETELHRASSVVYRIINEYPMLFRPPYGACSIKSSKTVCGLGFQTVVWSNMTNDYDPTTTTTKIAHDIIRRAQPGGIIGMHDGGGNREKTVAALQLIIDALKNEGYEFLTIPELLGIEAYRSKTCAETH